MMFNKKTAFVVLSLSASAGAFVPTSSFVGSKFSQVTSTRASAASKKTQMSMMAEGNGLRRVVVTGMGITSCLGNTLEDVTKSLENADPGITFSQECADLGIKSQVRGIPDISDADFKELIPKAALRFMGYNAKYAYVAMDRAIEDAGLKPEDYQGSPKAAAIIGQGGTSIPDIVETVDAVKAGGRWKNKVGPFRVTRSMGSTCSAVLATMHKVQGPSFSISSACSTGAHCIGTGLEQIQLGKADIAFCGAGENVNWQFTSMFDCMGALSTSYNDNPKTASRAFDKTRDGFVIAGGGGIIVLEELERAKARGAKIYAELTGYAANSDGYDMVAPSGVGGQRCMQACMDNAKENSGSDMPVEYINTHGTSTPVGDIAELGGIKTLFDELGYKPNVGSTKSLSGHALGAAGVHEAIYTILMMNNDFMAESANINELVDEAEGMNILTSRKDGAFKRAMSNSFGFGGTNCALIFDKYEE